jgi:CRISPR-associated protein Cas1
MTDSILVVDGYGVRLEVERGQLVVHDGFPAEGATREIRFPRGRTDVQRIVVRASAGTVSIAALDWCERMGIPVAFVSSDSRLVNCFIPDGSHDGPLRRAQAISGATEDALRIARWLLKKKLESQISALPGSGLELARSEIQGVIGATERDETLTELLAHEAYAARVYWDALVGTPLPWPDFAHKRIPLHWRFISNRNSNGRNDVRDARDPFNALLNYGYTLLEVETRIACAAEGLDPDLGYLHVDSRLRESFVYDLLESLRVDVDRLTIEWMNRANLRPWMFIELRDGVVRLDPDAARDYAQTIMPKLRKPSLSIAAEFAMLLRRISVPYRLVDHRVAAKKESRVGAICKPCEHCGKTVPRVELKFCGRQCYLRHSVEIRQPIKGARVKLAELRQEGLNPGWDASARKKREAGKSAMLRRRQPGMDPEQLRQRKAQQSRAYRLRRKENATEETR